MKNKANDCSLNDCGCTELKRRDFIRMAGSSALLAISGMPLMAGPFNREDFDRLVPADKKLDPGWVKSLFERGVPRVYKGEELRYIGMPVGGVCAGQMNLGGDGKLWEWNIFNLNPFTATTGPNYLRPIDPYDLKNIPIQQGFRLKLNDRSIPLDRTGFSQVTFRGEYPIGTVTYQDQKVPLEIKMEAFSPFIPFETKDSSLPATMMQFTVTNRSPDTVEATLTGFLQNGVCGYARGYYEGVQKNRIIHEEGFSFLECTGSRLGVAKEKPQIVFEDWTKPTFEGWEVQGNAFVKPVAKSSIPANFGVSMGDGEYLVHSYFPEMSDEKTGKLISKSFTIEQNFITFWIGGGNHPEESGLQLLIDGKIAFSATGKNDGAMTQESFDVKNYLGKKAHIEIIDEVEGGWGNTSVGKICFVDQIRPPMDMLEGKLDEGTMGLVLFGAAPGQVAGINLQS